MTEATRQIKPRLADRYRFYTCGSPTCHSLHLVLIDDDEGMFAQATINVKTEWDVANLCENIRKHAKNVHETYKGD